MLIQTGSTDIHLTVVIKLRLSGLSKRKTLFPSLKKNNPHQLSWGNLSTVTVHTPPDLRHMEKKKKSRKLTSFPHVFLNGLLHAFHFLFFFKVASDASPGGRVDSDAFH